MLKVQGSGARAAELLPRRRLLVLQHLVKTLHWKQHLCVQNSHGTYAVTRSCSEKERHSKLKPEEQTASLSKQLLS